MSASSPSADTLERELQWLQRVIQARVELYFGQGASVPEVADIDPPDLDADGSFYASVVKGGGLGVDERLVLILALAPELRPQCLDVFLIQNKNLSRRFSEFGGVLRDDLTFTPTLATAAFLIAGEDLGRRFETARLFEADHFFAANKVLSVRPYEGPSFFGTPLAVSPDFLMRLMRQGAG